MSDLFLSTADVAQYMLDDFKSITGITLTLSDLKREEVVKILTYAGAISQMRASLRQTYDDIFPASSSVQGLINHLATRGLPAREPAGPSNGVVRMTGVNGTSFATGIQIKYNLDGRIFVSISSGVVAVGYVDITFQSLLTGQDQNIDLVNQSFSLVSPIVGIDTACTNQTQFLDGRDIETPEEILTRIQIHDQDDDTGGNLVAYERFAKEASSQVVTATSIKNPRGAGTINTVITSGTTDITAAVNNGNAVTRLPSAALVNLVQAYILTKNPVTDDHQTIAPTEDTFNVTFTYKLYDETLRASVNVAITKLIKIYIYQAASAQTLYPTDLERIVDAQLGHLIIERRVSDFSGGGPEYTVGSSKLLVPGTITLSSF